MATYISSMTWNNYTLSPRVIKQRSKHLAKQRSVLEIPQPVEFHCQKCDVHLESGVKVWSHTSSGKTNHYCESCYSNLWL